ncbi:MAG TPA: methyltransferase domain-containing protein [Acidimicrobiales bacterium]|nr:methyltransferase domain-containing protein [Acidimicrobiales bacterium]
MKEYMTAALAKTEGSGVVLDLGCGVGSDLARLASAGLSPLGIDSSERMLNETRARHGHRWPLARADAAALPLRDATVAGCRIERLLQHVPDPWRVLDDVARVMRHGGWLAVFEPDWDTFRVESVVIPDGSVPARLLSGRNPRIGSQVADRVESFGFEIYNIVNESSRANDINDLPINCQALLERAVQEKRLDQDLARRWWREQQDRMRRSEVAVRWDKILTLARRR